MDKNETFLSNWQRYHSQEPIYSRIDSIVRQLRWIEVSLINPKLAKKYNLALNESSNRDQVAITDALFEFNLLNLEQGGEILPVNELELIAETMIGLSTHELRADLEAYQEGLIEDVI